MNHETATCQESFSKDISDMANEPHGKSCHSCQANWTQGDWTPDCRECGGGALELDCNFCGGRCGAKWQRAIMDSHDLAKAHWGGSCQLSPKEQQKIREKRIQVYEQEHENRNTSHSGFKLPPVPGWVARILVVTMFVGVMNLVRNGDEVLHVLGIKSDDAPGRVLVIPPNTWFSVDEYLGEEKLNVETRVNKGTRFTKPAYSDSSSLSGKHFIWESRERLSMRENGHYELDEMYVESRTDIIRDGVKRPGAKEIDTTLPDLEKGEYEYRILKVLGNGEVFLISESLVRMPWGLLRHFAVEAEVEFIDGDYERYTTGGQVTLRYTEKGLQQVASALEEEISDSMGYSIRRSSGARANVVSAVRVTKMFNETITMDLSTMEVVADGPFELEFEFKTYW